MPIGTAKMPGEDWDDLRFVLAVGRNSSFAAAARRLRVNESTVARRIARAERRFGMELFERGVGSLSATAAGSELVRRAEAIERQIEDGQRRLAGGEEASGEVRITSVPLIVNHLLAPAVPRLMAQHPRLRLVFAAEPRALSVTRREADIAVRLARPKSDQQALTRRIGELRYAVYGAADARPESLPWVGYDERLAELPQARWLGELAGEGVGAPVLVADDAETVLSCVRAGAGKALLPMAVGERLLDLVRHGDAPPHMSREVWLLVAPQVRDLARVQAVLDWLIDTFRGSAADGEGDAP